ncbi:hypothetical protein EDB83DRAFT_2528630 [Lactarius deliciosus]|nr:hypothetical protein EDB83DRAFT_2528630 [Lactarius deliciosus]
MALGSLASGPGGETEEAISEGTFGHQVAALVGYISSGRPELNDTERAPYFESIRQTLVVEDSQNLQLNDIARPRQRTRPTARSAVPAPTSTNDSSSERQRKGALLNIRVRLSQSEAARYGLPEPASQATQLTTFDAITTALPDSAIFDFEPLVRPTWPSLHKRSLRSLGYS